jgi:triphosphatase
VFALETLPRLAALQPNHAGLQWLGQSAQLTRRQHDARASTAVAARRYQGLLLGLGAWLARRPWRDDAAATVKPETPVIEFAASVLQERHRKLRKSAKELTNLPADQRHAARIAAKKLRYAGEFFASLYPRKNTRHYIDALADLQDALGRMNDCATALTLVDQMRGNEKEQAHIDALGMARGFALGASDAQIGALNNAGKRFRRQNTFW